MLRPSARVLRKICQTLDTKRSRDGPQSYLHVCQLSLNAELALPSSLPGSYRKRRGQVTQVHSASFPYVACHPALFPTTSADWVLRGPWLQVQSYSEEEDSHWPSRPGHHHLYQTFAGKDSRSEWISRLSLSLSLCLSRFSNWAAHCKHMLRFLQILTMKCPTSYLLMEPRDCFFVCFFLKLLRRVILLWLDKYFSKSVTLRI